MTILGSRRRNNIAALVSKRKPRQIAPSTEKWGVGSGESAVGSVDSIFSPLPICHSPLSIFLSLSLSSICEPHKLSIPLPGNQNPINGQLFNKPRVCASAAGKKIKRLATFQAWREFCLSESDANRCQMSDVSRGVAAKLSH